MIILSYMKQVTYVNKKTFFGHKKRASGRTRTGDPRITNALRYQLRYRSIFSVTDGPHGII